MSRPDDFDRLDRADGPPPPGELNQHRLYMKAHSDYYTEYHRAKAADPASVAGLPDPDGDPQSFDPAEALARLRGAPQTLRADPPREVRG